MAFADAVERAVAAVDAAAPEDRIDLAVVNNLTLGHVLGLLSVFTMDGLNCGTLRLVKKYRFLKHFLAATGVFLAVEDSDAERPLLEVVGLTVATYAAHIMLARMSPMLGLTAYGLIYLLMLANAAQKRDPDNEDLRRFRRWAPIAMVPVVFVGVGVYARKQYRDHREDWSLVTFLLGTSQCEEA